jgi:hypothetical protein
MAEVAIPYTLVTPAGTITFNPTGSQSDGMYLTDVSGLDQPTPRVAVDNRPQFDGGIIYTSWFGPRYPVLTGSMRYLTTGFAVGRRPAEDALRAALASILRADGTLTWTPSGGSARQVTVRAEQMQISNEQGPLKGFQIALVAVNPTVVESTGQSVNASALTGGGSPAWGFPFHFPFGFGNASSGGKATVTNLGNAPAWPVITVTGAITAPLIQNNTTGLQISLPALNMGDGDTLVVDCYAQTVLLNQVQGIQYIDPVASTFFTIDPNALVGPQEIHLYGNTFDSLAGMTVAFSNSWY